jgi:ketosteroid isomerase-like protein
MHARNFVLAALCLAASHAVAAPSPEAGRSSQMAEDIAPVVAAEERRRAAMNANDAEALAPLLSDELIYIHSNGLVDDRAAYLARVKNGPGHYQKLTVTNFRVRRDGAIAICDGAANFEYVPPKGEVIRVKAHFLAVWKLEGGAWRLAAYSSPPVT